MLRSFRSTYLPTWSLNLVSLGVSWNRSALLSVGLSKGIRNIYPWNIGPIEDVTRYLWSLLLFWVTLYNSSIKPSKRIRKKKTIYRDYPKLHYIFGAYLSLLHRLDQNSTSYYKFIIRQEVYAYRWLKSLLPNLPWIIAPKAAVLRSRLFY